MREINKLENKEIYILRKEPTKIYSFSFIMLITLVLLSAIGILYNYSKYQNYVAIIVTKDGYTYLNTVVTEKDLEYFKTRSLIIDREKYEFEIIEVQQNNNDNNYNNYNIILRVDDIEIDIEKEKYIIFSLKTLPTTVFKEIYKKLKEDLISWRS